MDAERTAAHFDSLPTRRCVANVLLSDPGGRILLVKPTYRDGWLLPGGTVDAGEAPWAAATRELHEELGLHITVAAPIVIQHYPGAWPITEALHFVFRGPTLTTDEISAITLPPDELSAAEFMTYHEAVDASPAMQRDRLRAAWNTPEGATPVLLG